MRNYSRFNSWHPIYALLLILICCASASAFEDGGYCLGPDYLAYEVNDFNAPGHRLYLVELNTKKEFGKVRQVELERFQIHGMRCLPEGVDLLAWDRIYRVELTRDQPLQVSRVEPQAEDSIFPDFTNDNLLPAQRIISLKGAAGQNSFELVIEPSLGVSENGQTRVHRLKITLQEKDTSGVLIDQQPVFVGSREETVD